MLTIWNLYCLTELYKQDTTVLRSSQQSTVNFFVHGGLSLADCAQVMFLTKKTTSATLRTYQVFATTFPSVSTSVLQLFVGNVVTHLFKH